MSYAREAAGEPGPHVRGGEPWQYQPCSRHCSLSSHPWGEPICDGSAIRAAALPHTRGGEPREEHVDEALTRLSPHQWGVNRRVRTDLKRGRTRSLRRWR